MYFVLILFALEVLVGLQAAFAYRDGYLTMAQAKKLPHEPGKVLAVWIEHFGMWGDVILVSPVCAYIIVRFFPIWTTTDFLLSALISFVAGAALLWLWEAGSKNLDESLARDGELTVSGWLHGLYMMVAIFWLVLFFVFTPVAAISHTEASWISVWMMVHVFLGFVCPEINTYRRVSTVTLCSWLALWAAIAYRWYCMM